MDLLSLTVIDSNFNLRFKMHNRNMTSILSEISDMRFSKFVKTASPESGSFLTNYLWQVRISLISLSNIHLLFRGVSKDSSCPVLDEEQEFNSNWKEAVLGEVLTFRKGRRVKEREKWQTRSAPLLKLDHFFCSPEPSALFARNHISNRNCENVSNLIREAGREEIMKILFKCTCTYKGKKAEF